MTKQFLLEDVNALLNTGDVPNLFATEEFMPFIDKLRIRAKKEGLSDLHENGTTLQFYDYFVESGKRKLHVILTMSPIGDSIRNRIRLFPSIVNCSTIDCYQQWPDEALEAVAKKFLSEISLDTSSTRQLIA
jgi:dynein heavy chain